MQQPSEATVLASMGRDNVAERIVLDAAGERIGLWRASIDPEWYCELRTIVVAQPGRGAGAWALRSALAWAFEERGVHRCALYVVASNTRARALYEHHGFVLEGTEREGFRSTAGAYEDLCHYGMLEGEYAEARRDG
jgi:RimJ/RimL family protein N-acetyltransferase